MRTESLIFLSQHLPEKLRASYVAAKMRFCRKAPRLALLEDIDHFPSESPKTKKALVVLSPDAWLVAVQQHPNISLFNYFGLIHVIVQSLNENGYLVDIADLATTFEPSGKDYDLLVGHGGKCREAIDSLAPGTPIFQYVSGEYWKKFAEESAERYTRYAQSRNISRSHVFGRDLSAISEGEEYLLNHADCLFTIGCPRMIESFGEHAKKFFITGLGAYPDPKLAIPHEEKDFEIGRTNFIYVGGTGGNVQKGLDLLLECFAKTPHLHLYIYCKVEKEITDYYLPELNLPNIHYVYHYRWPVYAHKLDNLMRRINFTVHSPINTGLGTAFSASLAAGLIPVGYVDYEFGNDLSVLSEEWSVEALTDTISRASRKSESWCKNASLAARNFHQAHFSEKAVRKKFMELFAAPNISEVAENKLKSLDQTVGNQTP